MKYFSDKCHFITNPRANNMKTESSSNSERFARRIHLIGRPPATSFFNFDLKNSCSALSVLIAISFFLVGLFGIIMQSTWICSCGSFYWPSITIIANIFGVFYIWLGWSISKDKNAFTDKTYQKRVLYWGSWVNTGVHWFWFILDVVTFACIFG